MKKIICMLFFLASISLKAQEVKPESTSSSSVPYDYELSDKQFSSWKKILNNWIGSDYQSFLAENKITMNCKNCGAVYIEVEIKIGMNGKMEFYKFIDGKKCGMSITKAVELRMMRNFFKFEFPPELRGA